MGNVHEVIQVEPYHSLAGAALPIRPGGCDSVAALLHAERPSYVGLRQATRRVTLPSGVRVDLPDDRMLLTIQTGGKSGWEGVETFLENAAPHLEEAVFYLHDEYVGYLREFWIADDELIVTTVVEQGADVGVFLAQAGPDLAPLAFKRLTRFVQWPEDLYFHHDEAAKAERFCAALAQVAPDSWQRWAGDGRARLDLGRPRQAVQSLTEALRRQPDGEAPPGWLLGWLFDALALAAGLDPGLDPGLDTTDTSRALEFGRQWQARWQASGPLRRCHQLATLEADAGNRAAAVAGWSAALVDPDKRVFVGQVLYDMACLHALSGERDNALDWLRVAFAVDPAQRQAASSDDDLAGIREDPQFSRLIEPPD